MKRYAIYLPTYDNSAVDTRQVRRQSERLAAKGRRDLVFDGNVRTRVHVSSKYMPHNGKRETARRVEQAALKAADLTRKTADKWLRRHAA